MAKQKTINDLHLDIIDLGFKIDQQDEKFVTKEEFSETRDLVMTTLDKVLVEVIAMRQKQSAHFQQHEDINTEINGLKKRVKKVEDNQQTPQL